MGATRHLVRFAIGLALLAPIVLGQTATAQEPDKKPAEKPNIDLVICLDTSGSMNGLIESAKAKLWDIVNELAKAKPTPNLRIALFSYGSPQYGQESGWVRKELDFTTDLDMVYQKLFPLRTGGGTEYVARVSKAALDQLDWSKNEKTLRLIFVCGNESAAQDPMITLQSVAQEAVKRNIFINTIHCPRGNVNNAEAQSWQQLAALAEGRFVSIDQDRGAVVVSTPVDKKLAELGARMNQTYVWYGAQAEARRSNQMEQDKNAAKLGGGAFGARVAAKTSDFYRMPTVCLVDRLITDPKFDVTKVPEKDLPEELKKLKPEERVRYVEQKKAERLKLQQEITKLSKERDEFLRTYREKNQSQNERVFDQAIRECLQVQARSKGIEIPR